MRAASVSGEKKHITVLFADVAGSMDLQERLDAEVWAGIMGRFVSILAEGVRRFGGTVDKFTGDGIMALFGAPVAQEDHARRACHAAWHLMKAIGEYSEELRHTHDVELQVRLGLNSGEVVVGRVGDDVTLDPTALGHTVGLAQRMEAMAQPGQTYLTEQTARLVEGWFNVDSLGARPVKGASEAMLVYALRGPMSRPVRRGGGASPLVGRERELAVLDDALAMACEGHVQVVGVVGEAGVGKSRLCDEFTRRIANQEVTVRRTSGVSHARDAPFLPILALLRDYFEIADADDGASARQKIEERVLSLDPAADTLLPLLFEFLEVPDPARPPPQLAPEVRMRRVFDALRRLTQRRSERAVLVLIVEDLHWFDPQSEVFLERLIESFPGSRTLVVANFRPEFAAAWMRHSYYRQLPLAPLGEDGLTELLGGLLGVDLTLTPLVAFVSERTGGNPFFVEELVRALVEDGILAGGRGRYRLTRALDEVRVPPSVQAVLAARIDRLPGRHKKVLQTAAVIGRTFDAAVLAKVTGSAADVLDDALSALRAAELLEETGQDPIREYRFWHPLTQEVAYGSLLADHRRHLHAAVADAVARDEPERLDELSAVIAWHWEQAGDPLQAATWNLRAGAWAIRTDLSEAERRWRATLDLLQEAPESRHALEVGVRARVRLMQWGARRGADPGETDRLLQDGRRLAERSGDLTLQSMLTYFNGSAKMLKGDVQGGLADWSEGARLAESTGDAALMAALASGPILGLICTGPLDEALWWADRAVTLAGGDPDLGAALVGYSPLVRARSFRAELFLCSGRLNEAKDEVQASLGLSRRRSEPELLAWCLALLPRLAWLTGETADTLGYATEAIHVAEDSGNPLTVIFGYKARAYAQLILGNGPEAVVAAEWALGEARSRQTGLFVESEILSCLAHARLAAADPAGAGTAAAEALAVGDRQAAHVSVCLAHLTQARVARATAENDVAVLSNLNAGLNQLRQTGAFTYEPFLREELGRVRDDVGQLTEALRLYRQIGAAGHAHRLESELSTRTIL